MATPYDIPIGPTQAGGFNPQRPQPQQQNDPFAAIMPLLLQLLAPQQGSSPTDLITALRNDPQGDANKGYVPGVNNANNPFDNGFFKSGASDLSPQALLASQGPSAMNQWASFGNTPGAQQMQEMNRQVGNARFDSADLGYQDPVAGAVAASPVPFQLNPDTLAMAGLTGSPGTLQSPERTPARRAQAIPQGPPMSLMGPAKKPMRGKASANPFSGFSFGAGTR